MASALIILLLVGLGVGLTLTVLFVVLIVQSTRRRRKMGINIRKAACPDCGTALPAFRKPANARQAFFGGWTCACCGCEVDKWGRKLGE